VSRRGARVAVVGTGIVGAACAERLAAEGFAVTLVGDEPPGHGATAAGMGHVVVMDDSEAQLALTRYGRELWTALAPELPSAAEYVACGTLWVAADSEERGEAERKHARLKAAGVKSELVRGEAVRRLEPQLRPGLAGGLLVAEDAVVYPPVVAAWLVARAMAAGAALRVGARVSAIEGRVLRFPDGARVEADVVVNAAGATAQHLTPGLPVRPRKGQLVITARYPGFARRQMLELGYSKSAHASAGDSVAFNVQPRPTGQLLVGSSRQSGDESGEVRRELLARMLRRAFDYLPALARLQGVRAWTGFRAATPDALPLLGPWPAADGLWLATGHEGLGISTALASARLLADALVGRPTAIPLDRYSAERFASHAGA
jgi:glycine/D-amino acid oxidase-like deaminating enzyme